MKLATLGTKLKSKQRGEFTEDIYLLIYRVGIEREETNIPKVNLVKRNEELRTYTFSYLLNFTHLQSLHQVYNNSKR